MTFRSALLLIVFLLLLVFTAVNWTAFTAPTELSFLVASVQAPLGVIMLGVVALLALLFVAWAMYMQTASLLESRRYAKELESQRALADRAEASRFTELQKYIGEELAALRERQTATEDALRQQLSESTNTLSAYIGEVEDRITSASRP